MDKLALQKEVADKYDLQHIKPGCYDIPRFGVVNLPELTLAQADRLFARKFPYLVLKPAAPAADATTVTLPAAPQAKTKDTPKPTEQAAS